MESIGPYRLDSELGHGAMGVVFRGFDPAIGRAVAIKIIRLDQYATADEKAEIRLRFAREATAAGKLSHPNIVTVYHLGEQGDLQYLVLELVDGWSLEKALSNGKPQDRKVSISILSQVAGALDYAHGEGIVHRDVKPANILVRLDGKAKITDFGIARISSQTVTKTGFSMGTPAYMAPEQIMSARVNGQADQFSLAVIAYQMLSGRRPFTADTDPGLIFKIVSGEAQPLHEVDRSFPPRASEVLRKGLAKDPDQRYATCAEFIKNLADSLEGRVAAAPVAAPAPVPEVGFAAPPSVRQARAWGPGWAIAFGAGLLVLLTVLVIWGIFERPAQRPIQVAESKVAMPPSSGTASIQDIASPTPRTVRTVTSPDAAPPSVGRAVEKHSDTPAVTPPRPVEVAASPALASHIAAGPQVAAPRPPASSGPHVGDSKLNSRDGLKYMWIPPGTFMMGCSPGDDECLDDEKPSHEATISKGFWLGQTDVTQAAYQRVMGSNYFKGGNLLPVDSVTWDKAQTYCATIGSRLPTEAEWEYAARAGSTAARYGNLDDIAWYSGNSEGKTHEVGQKQANAFGLYDMLGNVWQWTSGVTLRGGSWNYDPRFVRVSYRVRNAPGYRYINNGFRCVGE